MRALPARWRRPGPDGASRRRGWRPRGGLGLRRSPPRSPRGTCRSPTATDIRRYAPGARCTAGRTRRSGPTRSRRCAPRGTRCGTRRVSVSWGSGSHSQRAPDQRRNRRSPSMPQVPGRVTPGRPTDRPGAPITTNCRSPCGSARARTRGNNGIAIRQGCRRHRWRLRDRAGLGHPPGRGRGVSGRRRPRRYVGRSDDWPGIVEAVITRFGGIDLAHLNAGVTTGEADITKVTDDIYRRAVGVNVDGVVFGVRALVPALSARGGGAIVATASLAGLIGFSPDPIYCLTKHAVVGLVRSLGPQLAEHHITINAVCPSIVDTPLIDDMREVLEGSGFPLIDVATVSEAVFDRLVGEETGEAMVIQAGREALPFRFARPPGPRVGGTVGQMPPEEFAAHDQG